jgi:cation diffusion facilitator CzcD-associated flavoprotein CzcO
VPSHLYSFSFARNPAWSDTFTGQAEIWAYLRATAVRFGVTPHLRLGQELLGADWDTPSGRWRVLTSHGEYSARVLVVATGPLSQLSTPDIPGLPTFAGTTFHWSSGATTSTRGRPVAVIGTGASAIQFVPEIALTAGSLRLFQRTAPCCRAAPDHPPRARGVPVGAGRADDAPASPGPRAVRVGFLHPRQPDGLQHRPAAPAPPGATLLRRSLRPTSSWDARVPLSNNYYPALTRTTSRW